RSGSTWNSAVNLSQSPGTYSNYPDITLDNTGKLFAVWAEAMASDTDIVFRSSVDGGTTWTPCKFNISNTPLSSNGPNVTHANFGADVKVMWFEGNSSPFLLMVGSLAANTIAPIATILSPLAGSVAGGIIDIIGTIGGSEFSKGVMLHGVGSSPSTWDTLTQYSSPITQSVLYSWNTVGLGGGNHTLLLIANGSNCVSDSDRVTITIDNLAPVAANTIQTNPYFSPNGDLIRDTTRVSFNLSKPCLVTARIVDLANGLIRLLANGLNVPAGTVNLSWDGKDGSSVPAVDGQFTLKIEYADLIGNLGQPLMFPLTKDNQNPIIVVSDTTNIFGSVWDLNFETAYIYRDTASSVASDSLINPVFSSLLWTPRATAPYRIKAYDLAGNLETGIFVPRVVPAGSCGDADGSSDINIADAVYLIAYIFTHGPAPSPLAAGDADCDGVITIADVVYLINYIFSHGAAPCDACK
ncbi:MAG: dockerin type I domain-containing protein, partial [candidate division Zixibacteria bacterium]|nr:dockerin type I domain-containing protein [candidate division Zixibacteria bacterium]